MKKILNLPNQFEPTTFGGWISPLGIYFPRKANISSDPILRSKGVDPRSHDERFLNISHTAMAIGWVEIDYKQRKRSNLSEFDMSKTARRTVVFNLSPASIDRKQELRVFAVSKFFTAFFKEGRTLRELNLFNFGEFSVDRRFRTDIKEHEKELTVEKDKLLFRNEDFLKLKLARKLTEKRFQK